MPNPTPTSGTEYLLRRIMQRDERLRGCRYYCKWALLGGTDRELERFKWIMDQIPSL